MTPMGTASDVREEVPTPVRLSPSQKSYRSDPQGFVNRLSERAARLFEDGYVVYPAIEPHVFIVANHGGKEEKAYQVNALEGICTCPFYARQAAGERLGEEDSILDCKHLWGFSTLVVKTRRWLFKEGQIEHYCALWTHWMKTLSAIRKRRIQREKAQEPQHEVTNRKDGVTW